MNAADTLAAAGRRQAEIDRHIAAAVKKLKDRLEARKGRPGRMSNAEQRIEDGLNAALKRLRAGHLPGELMSTARAPTDAVAASAQQNLQHHAAGAAVPSGRPAAGSSSSGAGRSSGGSSSGARGAAGARSGAGAGAAARAGGEEEDDDDDSADPIFRNYYRITPQQHAFNLSSKDHFKTGNAANLTTATYVPNDVIKSGCKRELIGVGSCHVHAPHLYLGLPIMVCPRCGWDAVDRNAITSGGWCDARRVYDDGIDEWVVGQRLVCAICKKKHDAAADVLRELQFPECCIMRVHEGLTAERTSPGRAQPSPDLCALQVDRVGVRSRP